jgi:hypothetical protein
VSTPEHVLRCRAWLEEQIEVLGNVRNASPRDSTFKLWRQNTLTVLQRIWPKEPARSERFRRIPFSPPSLHADPLTAREWFSRGCVETTTYLRALIDEIDVAGVPYAAEDAGSRASHAGAHREDDFPVLELPTGATRTPAADADHPPDEIMLDLGPSSLPEAPATPASPADEQDPSPPSLVIDLRGTTPPSSAPVMPVAEPTAPRPHTGDAPPTAKPQAPRGPAAVSRANPPKIEIRSEQAAQEPQGGELDVTRRLRPRRRNGRGMKLKDMLGLHDLEQASGHAAAAPEPQPVEPAAAPEPAAPPADGVYMVPQEPANEAPMPAPAALAPAAEVPMAPAPEPHLIGPEPPSLAAPIEFVMPAHAPVADVPEPHVVEPRTPVITHAPAPPPPELEPEEPHIDPEQFAEATADFLRNSPVLGLQGRPVQRASDSTAFLEPDAVAVATLAADLGRLGVPENARGTSRTLLLALAQQMDKGVPEWPALRATVADAMEHPELARRLMPVLLPWLDRAA